jgi:tetratricopeptide (TPR) repeat protein
MGRKPTRTREFIYFCIAGLIVLAFQGCAALEETRVKIKGRVEAYQCLHRGRGFLAQGNYEAAFHENLTILSLARHTPPEDEALFNMGWIYAHPGNSKKDYEKSIFFFKKLLGDFPQSPWGERTKIWVGILEENEKLNREIEAFNRIHEKWEKIDGKIKEHEKARESFLLSQELLAKGNYDGALMEYQRILSLSGQNPPGDEALFNIGLIHAHPGNIKKDYGKSLTFFKKLIKEYPESPWVEPAKIFVGMLQENEKLGRSIEELSQVIEKSKRVDIEIEEKKREKTK